MLESDRQGHFQVEARVEGRLVDLVVDIGASLVVLLESSAALAGIRMQPRDYTATAITANGRIKAAPARIDRIEAGGITVYDVPAMVQPDEVLSKNLLGVSFLSRLRRYEYANDPAARTVIVPAKSVVERFPRLRRWGIGFAPL